RAGAVVEDALEVEEALEEVLAGVGEDAGDGLSQAAEERAPEGDGPVEAEEAGHVVLQRPGDVEEEESDRRLAGGIGASDRVVLADGVRAAVGVLDDQRSLESIGAARVVLLTVPRIAA